MTFLHKLAKRLAGIPALGGIVLLLTSCGEGQVQDYLGPDPNPPKTFVSLSISPRDPRVAAGDSIHLDVTGWLSTGQTAPIQVTWSATGGYISTTGWFRPDSVGEFRVRAMATVKPSLTDSVRIQSVNLQGGIARLEILPAGIAVPSGATQQFIAQAVMLDGSLLSPTVAWSATGGTITSSGLFTASGPVGSASVSATLGAGLPSAQSIVAIQPAILTQLVLNPSTIFMEVGEQRQLSVAASWSDGSSTPPPLIWSLQGGTLNSQNVFTAGMTPGTYPLIVTSPAFAKADTSLVWVLPRIVGLRLAPATVLLAPGAVLPIQAFAIRNDGSEGPAGIQWTATGGSIASNGKYTAGSTPGQYRVIGTLLTLDARSFSDTALVSVTNGSATLTQLSVIPHATAVVVGTSFQFTVSGSWSDGSSAVPAVTWAATGGAIDESGLYAAGQSTGTYRVIATQFGGTLADTAMVTVAPSLQTFRITPKVDTMASGDDRQFSATLSWSDGQTHPVTISWSTTGGVISPTGVYSPGALVGSVLVVAVCSCGAADTAAVTVQNSASPASPTLMSLSLSPHGLALALGGVQQFYPTGYWSDGRSGAVAVTYEATGGSVSSTGFYVAGNVPGTYHVIARHQGGTLADTAVVTINSFAMLNQVVLNPAAVVLSPGETQAFSVAGVWSDGSATAPAVDYSATGGSIGPDGLYTAGAVPGTYAVVATQQGGPLADTSVVIIAGPGGPTLTQLVMNPSAAVVFPGSTQFFTVTATWSNGSSTLPALSFSATGGTVSAAGLYTAAAVAGTYAVIVKHQGGTKADTSTVTIPSLTSLSLNPKPATVGAGGALLFSVGGTWSNGSATPPVVTYTATGGTISPAGLYLAGSTTGTYQVIARHTFGTLADTSVVTIGAAVPPPPGGGGPGDLVVFPSPEVEFIVGRQVKSGSASSPWAWFDQNQSATGLLHGAAFPVTPAGDPDHNVYLNRNYYDLGLALYSAYYRTGNPTLLTYARKVTDSWWQDLPRSGANTNFGNAGSPRDVSLGGLILRALDGRPEMWPWIEGFTRYQYQTWLGARLANSQLHYGVRDGGYMLLFTAWLGKVHPNATVRADFRQKALDAATQYYARLQSPDGGWYWLDPYVGPNQMAEPFMVGLLLDGMIATHQLTQDPTVAQSIVNAVNWMYTYGYETKFTTNLPTVRWRAIKYYVQKADPSGSVRSSAALYGMPDGAIRDARQLNPLSLHAFGYAFKLTGDAKYKQWGDEIFAATFGHGQGPGADAYWGLADFREKEYNASYRSSGRYLVLRLGY